MYTNVDKYTTTMGLLRIGMVDAETKELLWIGSASKEVKGESSDEKIAKVINKVMAEYPILLPEQYFYKSWKDRDLFSTASFSLVGGLEYMITDEFFIDARVSYGITNVIDQDLKKLEAKNHVLQFGFGMKI